MKLNRGNHRLELRIKDRDGRWSSDSIDVRIDDMVDSPNIAHFFVTALQQRCSVVTNPETGETVIIDGGGDSSRIIEWIDSGLGEPDHEIGSYLGERKVVALINTHAHFDHSGHIPTSKSTILLIGGCTKTIFSAKFSSTIRSPLGILIARAGDCRKYVGAW